MHVKTILHSWKEVVFPVVNLKSAFNKKRKDTLYLNLMRPFHCSNFLIKIKAI